MSKTRHLLSSVVGAAFRHVWLTVSMVVAALAVVGVLWHLNRDNVVSVSTDEAIDLTPAQVSSIKRIGQWSFLTIADEEMIDTVRHGFFSDDQLVRIYYGTLQIGIDLNDTRPDWITHRADSILVLLPKVKLLDERFIDEGRTRSFMETGKWTPADRKALYMKAQQAMKRRCLTPANYRSAEQHAASQFTDLMRSMGFDNVIIRFESPH